MPARIMTVDEIARYRHLSAYTDFATMQPLQAFSL